MPYETGFPGIHDESTVADSSVPRKQDSAVNRDYDVIALSPGVPLRGLVVFHGRIRPRAGASFLPEEEGIQALNGVVDPCDMAVTTENKEFIRFLIASHANFSFQVEGATPRVERGDLFEVTLPISYNGSDRGIQGTIPVNKKIKSKNPLVSLSDALACQSLEEVFEHKEATAQPLETFKAEDSRNIDTLHPEFKILIEELISNMESRGFKTNIITTFRSIETQEEKVKQGRSQTYYGYHNFITSEGDAASQAVDLTNQSAPYAGYGPDDPKDNPSGHAAAKDYFLALGEEAAKLGLDWGGNYSHTNPLWAQYGMGWDPAHVELKASPGVTLTQAKAQANAAGYTKV